MRQSIRMAATVRIMDVPPTEQRRRSDISCPLAVIRWTHGAMMRFDGYPQAKPTLKIKTSR